MAAIYAEAVARKRVITGKYGPQTNADEIEPKV
jgi:hypothetical protein